MLLSSNSIFEDDFKINQTKLYLCRELNTKLIYESLQTLKIVGIAGSINGKVVEVISHKIKDKKDYYKISIDESVIGWIALENSPRIYRIPKVTGKVVEDVSISLGNIRYELNDLVHKILEARYFFQIEEDNYLLVNRVSNRENTIPVLIEQFYKYILPKQEIYINVEVGEPLYKSSADEELYKTAEEAGTFKVIGFYEGLDKIKIKYENKTCWINKKLELKNKKENEISEIKSLEFIDQIMYLKTKSYLQKLKLDSQERRIQKIKENIAISNDLQKIYLTKYLGDSNDIK